MKKIMMLYPLSDGLHKKIRRIMRLFLIFTLMFTFYAHAESLGQEQEVSLEMTNTSFYDFLETIREQTGLNFIFNKQLLNSMPTVNLKVVNKKVKDVLSDVLKDTPYTFRWDGEVIMVVKREERPQTKTIKIEGIVKDEAGLPLPGVTVVIKGTALGIATDTEGKFSFTVPEMEKIELVFSSIGMETKELKYTKQQFLEVIMHQEDSELDEIIVTGLGTFKRSSFTGAVTTVSREELLKVSQTNVLEAIQAYDPSFRVAKNNIFGSDPNTIPEVYIRGRSAVGVKELDDGYTAKSNLVNNPNLPIFIMDGFEVSVEKVYDMDPNRIENLHILKDASATAMYGSRAANGVVVITTIPPVPGEVQATYTLTGTAQFPDLTDYNISNAKEKLELEVLAGVYDYDTSGEFETRIIRYNRIAAQIAKGVDTDWLSIPLRNILKHKHSLRVEGGSEDLRYALNAMYNSDGGVMKKSTRDKTNLSLTLDFRFSDIQVRNEVSYAFTKAKDSPYGDFSDYIRLQPYDQPYDDNGVLRQVLTFTIDGVQSVKNPLYEALLNNFSTEKYDEFINNFEIQWRPKDYFSIRGQFSIMKIYTKGERFVDPLSSKSSQTISQDMMLAGDLYLDKGEQNHWSGKVLFQYVQNLGKHNFNATLGIDVTSNVSASTYTHYRGFPSGDLSSLNYAAEVALKPTKTEGTSRLFGTPLTLNYSYNNIYLFDVSVRFDGSSKFGKDQKWASFWSSGFGINIHNYSFMKPVNYIDELRVKVSYGETGKTNFAPYLAKSTYTALTDEWYITGYGVMLMAMGNNKLSWETTQKFNTGIDLSIFKERINLSATYYHHKTIDLVNSVTIPSSSGFTSYSDNLGEILNEGYELNFRANIIKKSDLYLSVSANAAHNSGKIVKISESLKEYNSKVDENFTGFESNITNEKYSKPLKKYEENASLTSIWGMKSLGIDPVNGQELFVNRDGTITYDWHSSQQVVLGNTEPKLSGTLSLTATYKNFSLYAGFSYEFGGQMYNQTLVNQVENADVEYKNVDRRVLTQRWQKPGDVTPLKDIKDRRKTTFPTSRFVQDNNELILKSLTLGYDFEKDIIRKIGLSVLRLEVQTNDIFRWSTIKQERGTSYPFAREVSFTLRASF